MKKTASILLLAILAFNWIGYRFVSGLLEHKADAAIESKIDRADYDAAGLMQITVPLNAPYLSGNSSEFERYDGEIQIEGIIYRYVKRKIVDGNLVLLCLPNEAKNRLQSSTVDFFKLVNGLNHTDQSKEKNPGSSFKSFVTEYSQEKNCWSIMALHPMLLQNSISDNILIYTADYNSVLKQPPRA